MAPTAELSLTQYPMGNSHKHLLVWNQLLNWNQTLIRYSLDGPLPKLCLVVLPSDQDGHHSAVVHAHFLKDMRKNVVLNLFGKENLIKLNESY
jgi:hypothetical protein